jgi:hypothetical protein
MGVQIEIYGGYGGRNSALSCDTDNVRGCVTHRPRIGFEANRGPIRRTRTDVPGGGAALSLTGVPEQRGIEETPHEYPTLRSFVAVPMSAKLPRLKFNLTKVGNIFVVCLESLETAYSWTHKIFHSARISWDKNLHVISNTLFVINV